jgi:pilus assembly protein CpaF
MIVHPHTASPVSDPRIVQVEVLIESAGQHPVRRTIPVNGGLSIGRDASCTIALPDDAVSRCHALVTCDAEGMSIEDVSTNGTLVGDVTLRNRSLRVPYGTAFTLGTSTLRLSLPGAPLGAAKRAAPLLAASVVAPVPSPAVQTPAATHEQRREIHRMLLEHLDMNAIDAARVDDPALRPRVLSALRRIVRLLAPQLPKGIDLDRLVGQMADEALGLGPLEHLLADASVTEIMVVDAHTIYVERAGMVSLCDSHFTDDERVRAVIERIVTPLGRRVDESSPLVDARLANGSRVNVVIRPVAVRGSCITIRKFSDTALTLDRLCELGALSTSMARFLTRSVQAKKNIVIAGGTGSGKTTLLNALSSAIPARERIVTIEDAAELRLSQPHVVVLESRPNNMEGRGEISIRDLVRNALRMRPDRIVVGECRGGETLDMLQAMNTGHDGSLTTTHANSPLETLGRLETLALMAGVALPQRAIREQISQSIHLIVQQARLSDGSRKVVAIAELAGLDPTGNYRLRPIFEYERTGTDADGGVEGRYRATGYLPSFLPELVVKGLIPAEGPYL